MNQAAIRARLKVVGAEALCDVVSRQAYYGAFYGEDAEDFLQEAIVAELGKKDVRTALGRLYARKRYESSLDEMPGAADFLENENSDNERPDWIPEDLVARYRVIESCKRAIRISYSPKGKLKNGCFAGFLYVLNHQQFLGYFRSNDERGEAVREALERIIGWCTP